MQQTGRAERFLQNRCIRSCLQAASAISRGIYPSVSGGEMSESEFARTSWNLRQGINPQAESESRLKPANRLMTCLKPLQPLIPVFAGMTGGGGSCLQAASAISRGIYPSVSG
ncbi:MAG: hypothetical protein B6245_22470, partial [Desulfobacteraceae bacterium 4572_88]